MAMGLERLRAHPIFPGVRGPVVLGVMDGLGICKRPHYSYDAVRAAHTPNLDRLFEQKIYAELSAHGTFVGLPTNDDIGNSEVGHNALGAGKYIKQSATLVNAMLADGSFYRSEALNNLIENSVRNNRPLHLIGLLQRERSVHSHTDHLKAIIRYAAEQGVKTVFVHGLTDGRDDPEGAAEGTMNDVELFLAEFNGKEGRNYRVASGGGRMALTMDRYWEDSAMLERGWNTHVKGEGRQFVSGSEAVRTLKAETGKQDQWLDPFVIAEHGAPIGRISEGDSVIFFNYRGDRALEISAAFEQEHFTFFNRGPRLNVEFAGLISYDGDAGIPQRALVTPPPIELTISELLTQAGVRQLAITEGTKFGHLTYFWRGNRGAAFNPGLETDVNVASDPSTMFALRPWMKAEETTTALIEAVRNRSFRFGRINWAGPDMVGHTGDLAAAIMAVSTVDYQVGRLMRAIEETEGALVLTADHGNADEMAEVDKKGAVIVRDGKVVPRIGHTANPVPFYVYAPSVGQDKMVLSLPASPTIRNVAATALVLLGYDRPEHMDQSLVDFVG